LSPASPRAEVGGNVASVTNTQVELGRQVRADLPGRFSELDVLRRHSALFAATLNGAVLPPYEVLIHPSSSCNLRCVWCIGDHVPIELWDDERGEVNVTEAAKFADQLLPDTLARPEHMWKLVRDIVEYRAAAEYTRAGEVRREEFRVHNVSFSGLIGEPLVAKRALLPAMRFLVDADVRVGLFTNGVLIDDETIDVLVTIGYVHVSIDAATPETYARLKFKGRAAGQVKFLQALSNLEALTRRRETSGSETEINASFVLYPENHHELYEAASMLKGVGVDSLRLKQDNSGDRILEPRERAATRALVERVREELEDESFRLIEIHPADRPADTARTFPRCSITNLMAAVGSDGHLYPCNYHPRPGGASYGSAIETSFREVWEGSRRLATRSRLPHICPKVCDPFKNRANRMLFAAREIAQREGLDALEREVSNLRDPARLG
jgi:MoaA/NifB/PqqE/SkfB family radical SAM enzyme